MKKGGKGVGWSGMHSLFENSFVFFILCTRFRRLTSEDMQQQAEEIAAKIRTAVDHEGRPGMLLYDSARDDS